MRWLKIFLVGFLPRMWRLEGGAVRTGGGELFRYCNAFFRESKKQFRRRLDMPRQTHVSDGCDRAIFLHWRWLYPCQSWAARTYDIRSHFFFRRMVFGAAAKERILCASCAKDRRCLDTVSATQERRPPPELFTLGQDKGRGAWQPVNRMSFQENIICFSFKESPRLDPLDRDV